MVHSWATDKDDTTVMPRWGKIGKQIEDAGTLYPTVLNRSDKHCQTSPFDVALPQRGITVVSSLSVAQE